MNKKTDLELLDEIFDTRMAWSTDSRRAYEELVRRMKKREKGR